MKEDDLERQTIEWNKCCDVADELKKLLEKSYFGGSRPSPDKRLVFDHRIAWLLEPISSDV